MKSLTNGIVIGLCTVALISCSKKEEGKDGKDETAKTENSGKAVEGKSGGNTAKNVGLDTKGKSLGGDPVKLNTFKLGGEGFDGQFNQALDSWTYEKWEPQKGGGNDIAIRIYVGAWQSEWPADSEGFAGKLQTKDFLDFGSKWIKVDSKTAFEGGWVIVGDNNDGEDTEKAFAVQLTKQRILCRGFIKKAAKDGAASLKDGIDACKAGTI